MTVASQRVVRVRIGGRALTSEELVRYVHASPEESAEAVRGGARLDASAETIRLIQGTVLGGRLGDDGAIDTEGMGMGAGLVLISVLLGCGDGCGTRPSPGSGGTKGTDGSTATDGSTHAGDTGPPAEEGGEK